MATEAKQTTTDLQVPPAITPLDPALHLHQFLTENNYELAIDSLTENNPFLEGKGFVLTNRPLLVVTVKKKESKS